jgi:hypothetical protein
MVAPANEDNEKDTLLLLGKVPPPLHPHLQFGDGVAGLVRPVRVALVGEVLLAGPEGELAARGLELYAPGDMEYAASSVRMVYARMWSVADWEEGARYPTWPLPSSTYPNNCQSLFASTSHVVRVAFSGGVTRSPCHPSPLPRDGVSGVTPDQPGVFTLVSLGGQEVPYLGLADLGKALSASPGEPYQQVDMRHSKLQTTRTGITTWTSAWT